MAPASAAHELPADLITMRDASVLTGKSLDTVRRWRKVKGLSGYASNDPTAAVLVSKAEVLRVAAELAAVQGEAPGAARRVTTALHTDGATVSTPLAVQAAMQAHLASLEGTISDLRSEREALREEARSTRAELVGARQELVSARAALADRDARIRALEVEIHGGVRGLLRGVSARFGIAQR